METGNSENKGYYSDPAGKGTRGSGNGNNNSRILGIVVVVIGMLMLVRATDIIDYPILEKLISFPVFLIILALGIGYKNKFDVGAWVFLLGAGVYFLLRKFDYNAGRYAFPLVLITIGLFVLAKNRQKPGRLEHNSGPPPLPGDPSIPQHDYSGGAAYQQQGYQQQGYDPQGEFVKIDSIFSGNERAVLSSNFKGGKLGTIFGSVVLDCKAAQIQQDIVIDLYCVFGGVELIFPANWRVINETTTIFGAVEDKRRLVNSTGIERRVIITGFTLFGGVEIKNL